MGEFDVNSVPQDAGEVDSLLASIDAPTNVDAPEAEAPVTDVAPPEAPVTQAEKFKINWRGQERELSRDQVINYAQQAYDYNERNRQLNIERQLFQQESQAQKAKQAEIEQRVNRYREVEDYIKTNPQWWDHVNQTWQTRTQDPSGANPYAPVIQDLTKKVESLSDHITRQQEREKLEAQATKDSALDEAVSGYRQQYPDLDWKTVDQNGMDLERRILNHAVENNIGSFKAAANDLLFDELVEREKLKALEEKGKEIKKVAKLGLGPVTDKPQTKIQSIKNHRAKSWNDDEYSAEHILAELGA